MTSPENTFEFKKLYFTLRILNKMYFSCPNCRAVAEYHTYPDPNAATQYLGPIPEWFPDTPPPTPPPTPYLGPISVWVPETPPTTPVVPQPDPPIHSFPQVALDALALFRSFVQRPHLHYAGTVQLEIQPQFTSNLSTIGLELVNSPPIMDQSDDIQFENRQ